jgi:hypothetical protein
MNMPKSFASVVAFAALTVIPTLQFRPRAVPPTAAAVMGTYGMGTRRLPSVDAVGCWLETAPVSADSARVQVRCTIPPTHHMGMFDARLPFQNGTLTWATQQFGDPCRITVRFANGQAVVSQHGTAAACGFGANVNVAGVYKRMSRRRPPFDLVPVERTR